MIKAASAAFFVAGSSFGAGFAQALRFTQGAGDDAVERKIEPPRQTGFDHWLKRHVVERLDRRSHRPFAEKPFAGRARLDQPHIHVPAIEQDAPEQPGDGCSLSLENLREPVAADQQEAAETRLTVVPAGRFENSRKMQRSFFGCWIKGGGTGVDKLCDQTADSLPRRKRCMFKVMES